MFIDSGPSESNLYWGGGGGGGGQSSAGGLGAPSGSRGRNPLKLRGFCRFSTLKTNFFLVPNCMGFEQLKYSPPQSAASQQQSPEKHKLISHSKQDEVCVD